MAAPRPEIDRPELDVPEVRWADRTAMVRRAASRLCLLLGWSPLHEATLPNGRRADILALRGDGSFACIEVKSGARDFLTDGKWHEYRAFADALYFAVDHDFPIALLPPDAGLIVTCGMQADVIREAPAHALPPARRRALLHRFATLAAQRLACIDDPAGSLHLRTALWAE